MQPIGTTRHSLLLAAPAAVALCVGQLATASTITWTGAVNGDWDIGTTANWDDAGPSTFADLDIVNFGDSGDNKAIVLTTVVSPAGISFANTAGNDYGLTGPGSIGGSGGLAKSGAGSLTLAVPTSFTGATTIAGGTLVADSSKGDALGGSSSIQLDAPASLRAVHDDGGFSMPGNLSGDGAMVFNAHAVAGSGDAHTIEFNDDLSQFAGDMLLEAPLSGTYRLSRVRTAGTGDIVVEDGAQFWAGVGTFPNDITLTGDGYADVDGSLGALQLTGVVSQDGGTHWTGEVTVTGTPGDSGGITADASIGFDSATGGFFANIDGPITGGDLGVRSYSSAGFERLIVSAANSYGDTIVFANDVAGSGSGQEVRLLVGGPGNTTATLGTGTVYLSGGAGGKVASLDLRRVDGYTLPADVISTGNTAATRFVANSEGSGVTTNGHSITVGAEVMVASGVDGSILNIDAGSEVRCSSLNVGQGSGLTGTLNMTGGQVTVTQDFQAGPFGTGVLNLDGGSVTLGPGGLVGTAGSVLNLGGASLLVTEVCTLDFPSINVTGPSSIDLDGRNVSVSRGFGGSGTLTINDSAGGAFFDFNLANDAIVEPALAGLATIGKLGPGTLTLAGDSTHTGLISIDEGGLAITGSLNGSEVVVANGSTLHTGGSLTGDLELGDFGGAVLVDTGSPLVVDGNVTLLGLTVVDPFANGVPAAGTHELITFTGNFSGDPADLALPDDFTPGDFTPGDFRQDISLEVDSDSINLVVSGEVGELVWNGPGDWDLLTTTPWGGGESFFQVDSVLFDDTAADGMVNLVGSLMPGAIVVNNDTLAYRFAGTGSIDGSGSLLKQGPGTLSIDTANGYGGGTRIEGGVVEVGAVGALGTGTTTVSSGTLRVLEPYAMTGPIVLGDGNSGTAETVIEYLSRTSGGDPAAFVNVPLVVSGDAPDSKAILRYIGSPPATYIGGTITLENRDLYFENATVSIGGAIGRITGTGNLHTGFVEGNWPRTRLLNNDNDFVGDIYIDSGHLQVGDGSAGGTVTSIPLGSDVIIDASAGLRLSGSSVPTVGALRGAGYTTLATGGGGTTRLTIGNDGKSGVYDGDMYDEPNFTNHILALTKTGAGTQVLNGSCSFTGTTLVNGGTLEVNSPSYASAVTVNGGGTLGGDGTLSSVVIAIDAGATIAPGSSVGVLTAAADVDLGGGTLAIEIDDASTPMSDRLDVGGALTLTGGTLEVTAIGPATQSAYVIASYGTLEGTFATVDAPAGYTVDYAHEGNRIALVAGGASDYDTWAMGIPGFVETGPAADPDGDGVLNRDEYAYGLDPTDPGDFNPIKSDLDKATGRFTYTRRDPALTGLAYGIETTPDLTTWTVDGAADQVVVETVGEVQTVMVTLSSAPLTDPRLFARVVTTP